MLRVEPSRRTTSWRASVGGQTLCPSPPPVRRRVPLSSQMAGEFVSFALRYATVSCSPMLWSGTGFVAGGRTHIGFETVIPVCAVT